MRTSDLTITHTGDEVVLNWSGLAYRLEAVQPLGQAWARMLDASSPLVLPINTAPKYFRLICP